MPDFPIIDAHVHLYDPGLIAFPWMEGVPQLERAHLPPDFSAATGDVEVEAVVFLEVDAAPGRHMDEARFVEQLGARTEVLRAMVASMPLEEGPDTVAADLASYTAMPLARGVRRLIERHTEEPGWATREPFVAAVASLAQHGLSFDICIRHPQFGEAIELVRRCPDVSFVLDHIGKPGIRDRLTEPWRSDIKTLAGEPNVSCKVSGVVTEADHAGWSYDDVAPYIAHAIECFGFDRVMFGGDWPVMNLATDYPRWVATVDRVIEGASQAEQRKLYRENAAMFYRL